MAGKAVIALIAGPAAVLLLVLTPFLFVGGAGAAASPAAGSAGVGQTGVALPVQAGHGPSYVGGNVPPGALPYVPPGGYPDSYLNPAGQCTTWAAFLWPGHRGRGVTWAGDAWQWLANAAAQGYMTSSVPTLGAIVVWPRNYIPGSDATAWGHVAVVVTVDAATYTVSEMNVVGQYRVDMRRITLPGNQAGFIPVPDDSGSAVVS